MIGWSLITTWLQTKTNSRTLQGAIQLRRKQIAVATIAVCIVIARTASASCFAPMAGNGPMVPARELPGPSPFYAHSFFDPMTGYPTIVYSNVFFALPPIMQAFTRIHECGHLVLVTSDEIAANCYALEHMRKNGLSSQEENYIAW